MMPGNHIPSRYMDVLLPRKDHCSAILKFRANNYRQQRASLFNERKLISEMIFANVVL